MPALRAPADKLPLATRKNLRDFWEPKKPQYASTASKILGVTWTIDVNPNLIYQYCGNDDHRNRLGEVLAWYMDDFGPNLERFVKKFGSDGVQELNSACSKHHLIIAPQETTTFTYGGLVVENGALHLVFAESQFGVNTAKASQNFEEAVKAAPPSASSTSALNIVARKAIVNDYDAKIGPIQSAIASMVNMPNLTLNPNFESNAKELAKSAMHVREGWDQRIGWITLAYFEGLKSCLERQKFKNDEMQQEAFQEAVEMAQVCLRVLPQWPDGVSRYNEVKIEEGVLYIQTTTENWSVNTASAARGLVDML